MPRIVIIGTGNVASQLARALRSHSSELTIAGRNIEKASVLAAEVKAYHFTTLHQLPNSDLCIMAISDDAIAEVAASIQTSALIVHTSGSVGIDVLTKSQPRSGVFYPLQTFTKERSPDWKNIPLLVEAKSRSDEQLLFELAQKISDKAEVVNSTQRAELHVSAVFANNFTNYLLGISTELLSEHKLNHRLLQPLVQETIRKAFEQHPFDVQTGPAKRGDELTVKRHLNQLANHPEYQELYQLLSDQIKKRYE